MTTTQMATATSARLLPPETGRAGFADALRSEFTKIRSTRSTYWTLFALIVVCIGIGALASAGTASHPNGISAAQFDSTQQSLAGLIAAAGGTTVAGAGGVLVAQGLPVDRIGDLAFENSIRLHELAPAQASLEEAFMELTADSVEFQAQTPGQQDAGRTNRMHPTGVA